MKNFIDFIIDAAKDSKLSDEFSSHVNESSHQTISSWFKEKGYDVHENECKKIIDNKDSLSSKNLGLYPY
ncbi:hypothetical protein HNR50_004113 [Spirochaeta isovalerica]|uniref:Nif11 domain-containing protein n=2 Tax=Spirochaeta isovalerica TaxID=150 RepID=A0A841RAK3_9SPIO|nr:hypothetical protein [Spirochaeta isovalerica]